MTIDTPEVWELPIPLIVEVRKRALSGSIASPRSWLDALVGDVRADAAVAAFERELENSARIIDWGSWAIEDLPSEEVHTLDATGDLLGALNWVLMIKSASELAIGAGMYAVRDRVARSADDLVEDARRIGELLAVPDPEARALSLREAWRQSIEREGGRETTVVRASRFDEAFVRAVEASVNNNRHQAFPRSLFASRGLVRSIRSPAPEGTRFTTNALVPKIFFVNDPRHEVRPDDFGSSFASSLGNREAAVLARALHRTEAPQADEQALPDRLNDAVQVLKRRGFDPDAIFLWVSSAEMVALNTDERWESTYPRSADGSIGNFWHIPVFMLLAVGEGNAFVVDLGDALRETVYEASGKWVSVSIRNATVAEAVARFSKGDAATKADAATTPYAIASSSEAYELTVDANAVVRVASPVTRQKASRQTRSARPRRTTGA